MFSGASKLDAREPNMWRWKLLKKELPTRRKATKGHPLRETEGELQRYVGRSGNCVLSTLTRQIAPYMGCAGTHSSLLITLGDWLAFNGGYSAAAWTPHLHAFTSTGLSKRMMVRGRCSAAAANPSTGLRRLSIRKDRGDSKCLVREPTSPPPA